ncbi:MAG: tRNA 2-thiocytidine biosynthesis protein TtcA [Tepidanaerobacteraceae bacterium]|nr:tRNA 2-thiocytidine biosynthesis protein TtcA [Tepidanaerobacteraceae bacterium]
MDRNYGKWFLTKVKKAIIDYGMIEKNDRIAVGISGGKDSSALLFILDVVRKYSPFKFEMLAVSVDMGWGMDYSPIQKYCNELNVPLEIVETKIGPLVLNVRQESNPCSLCSKMRRGALDSAAVKLGCNKVALAHHADDIMETLFLNLIFTGRFATFEPKTYLSRKNLTLIRPLIYLEEKTIKTIVGAKKLPVLENPCPVAGTTRRNDMKILLDDMENIYPKARSNILAAMKRKNFFI